MARIFIKITDKETSTDYYLVWSTIVDAPITNGGTKEQLIQWIIKEYGQSGLKDVDFNRLEEKGTTSVFNKNLRETISGNRAGENEKHLSYKGILNKYCLVSQATDL